MARQIHDLRVQAGLTQRELAARAGTTASAICRLEDADYNSHSPSMLKRIADAKLTVLMEGQGKCDVRGSNEDVLVVNVQGNDQPTPWRLVSLENCARLAQEAAKEFSSDPDALQAAAVFRAVTGDEKEAEALFGKAGVTDDQAVRTTNPFLEAEAAK